jgi:hypothetical protein
MSGNDMEHSLAQHTTSDNDSNVTRSIPFEDWAQQTDTTQHPLPLAFSATPVLPAKGSQMIQTLQTWSSSVSRKAAPVLPTHEDPPPRPPGFSSKGGKIEQIQTFVSTLNEQPTTTTQQDAESPTPREDLWNGTERMCANTTPSTPTPNTTGLDTVLGIVGGNRPPHKDFLGTQPNVRSADLP